MRIIYSEEKLQDALDSARSEAITGFGNPELILEKAIIGGRHIEIQILADSFGHCLHLGERDCSLQRRHQKVIEEAPSPISRAALREAMGQAAIKAAQSCHYVGAGTVEFLLDEHENFYFLEMNTRIQVEHPVTELVTGVDIVEEQIRVALGEPLRLKQNEIKLNGHAIEARLYAEDPELNYMPQTGPLLYWKAPRGEGIRCDSGIENGYQVSPHYDAMLAKIIAHGENRNQAIRRLVKALRDTAICGVKTNRDFLIQLLNTDSVREGQFNTTTLENTQFISDANQTIESEEILAIASLLSLAQNASQHHNCWALIADHQQVFQHKEKEYVCSIQIQKERLCPTFQIKIKPAHQTDQHPKAALQPHTFIAQLWNRGDHWASIGINQKVTTFYYHFFQNQMWICSRDFTQVVWKKEFILNESLGAQDGGILSPMDGRIVKVNAQPGQRVKAGEVLALLDAMKIEHPIKSPLNGVIAHIHISDGQQVKHKQKLIQLEPNKT